MAEQNYSHDNSAERLSEKVASISSSNQFREGSMTANAEESDGKSVISNADASKKLFDVEAVMLYDLSSDPFAKNEFILKSVKVNWSKLKSFKAKDRNVSISRSTSLRAMLFAAAKTVKDESQWQDWFSMYNKAINMRTSTAKQIQTLALRLALSDPRELFVSSDWLDSRLVVSDLACAWFASQKLFGSLWYEPPKSVYSQDDRIKDLHSSLIKSVALSDLSAFTTEELMVDKKDSAADLERKFRSTLVQGKLMSVDDWEAVFRQVIATDIENPQFAQDLYAFGVKLIKTDPIFFEGLWQGIYLLENSVSKAWRGAINAFGAAWTFQSQMRIQEFLDEVEREEELAQQGIEKMRTDEDDDSLQEDKDALEYNDNTREQGTASKDTKNTHKDNIEEDEVAEEDAEETGSYVTEVTKNSTGDRTVTIFKKSVKTNSDTEDRLVAGIKKIGIYKDARSTSSTAGTLTQTSSERSSVSFTPVEKASRGVSVGFALDKDKSYTPNSEKTASALQRRVNNALYLSKERKTPHKANALETLKPAFQRTHTSYLKARLPRFQFDFNHIESQGELAGFWQSFTDCLFKVDPKLVIYPWNLASTQDPITIRSAKLTTKDDIQRYVERIFIKIGEFAWLRLRVGHDKYVQIWEHESVKNMFKDLRMLCYRDPMQCQKTANVGWFLGSHTSTNLKDLTAMLKALPEFKNIELEVRLQNVKIKATRPGKPIDPEDQVKACQVYTKFRKVSEVKKALNKIYGTKNKSGFPLGKIMLFVPNTSDIRFPVSHKTVFYASRCLMKQKCFLENTATATSLDIIGLDYVVDQIGISLRQAIMSIKHPTDNRKSLFIAVDDTGYNTTFLFRNEAAVEEMARSIIPVLCVLMEAEYGPNAWSWFSDDAKVTSSGFYWDASKRAIRSKDEPEVGDSAEEIDRALEHLEPGVDESFGQKQELNIYEFRDIHIEFLADSILKQQFTDGDGASMRSFRSACNLSAPSDQDTVEALLEDTMMKDSDNLTEDLTYANNVQNTPTEVALIGPTPGSSLSTSAATFSYDQVKQMMDAYPHFVQAILSQQQHSPAADRPQHLRSPAGKKEGSGEET